MTHISDLPSRWPSGPSAPVSNLKSGQITLSQVLSLDRKLQDDVWELFAGNMIRESHRWLLARLTEVVEITKIPGAEQYQALQKFEETLRQEFKGKQAPLLGRWFFPAVRKFGEVEQRADTNLHCACAALAAERFRLRNKRWPDSLDELIGAKLLPAAPLDLFTGQPVRFRRTADGLVIYSVGADGTYKGNALDNLQADDPAATRIEFRLWNPEQRGQLPKQ